MDIECPICNGTSKHHYKVEKYGEMRKCIECGLIFAYPLKLPQESKEFFTRAYEGKIQEAQMLDFYNRVLDNERQEELGISLQILDPAKRKALKFINKNISKGSYILDIGCGNGEFLNVLSNNGYKPLGIDPSKVVVDRLKKKGYMVWYGTLDNIQEKLPEPALCTSFRVLHHSPDPFNFVKNIKKKFPNSPLIISDCGNEYHIERRPPRHLTIWNPQSMKILLEKVGYRDVMVCITPLTGEDIGFKSLDFFSLITKIPGFSVIYKIYNKTKPIFLNPFIKLSKSPEKFNHIFAYGKPNN